MAMFDPFGRPITYLRVSVTDRCDLRCVYCMSEDMTFLPKRDLLSLEELDRLCSTFIDLGVRKLRLTGGEPLVRRNVLTLIQSLGRHLKSGALDELTLTTNGTRLANFADRIVEAGIRRINVSLDTLNGEIFRRITRWGNLDSVLEGLDVAKRAGLSIKINTVAMRGINEHELPRIVEWCGEQEFDLTFIETMPMGDIDGDRTQQYLPLSLVRSQLEECFTLNDTDFRTGGPARYTNCKETGKRVGFITPMTHNFCESCNRVRLTCTGMLYMCLGQDDNADLRKTLRKSESNETLVAAIHEAISRKPKGHDFIIDRRKNRPAVSRHMSVTGG